MTDEHAAARAMYQDYVARAAVLERNRLFADEVVRATSGSSKTPVEPLATMGKGGGPLRCDVCGQPMVLEGGGFQGVCADVAWRSNPVPGWTSYISGGMVVSVESNRTLRIYHGYPGGSGCVGKAEAIDERSRAEFRERSDAAAVSAKMTLVRAFLKAELPNKATDAVMSDIYRVLFVYDPGVGINGMG
jgi:hypothetical protein